jgi:anti-sigma B factor antagonist
MGSDDGLAVAAEHAAETTIVTLVGELDLRTAPLVRETLLASEAAPIEALVIDLSGLTFIDSSGLHLLVEVHERLRSSGPRLEIQGATAAAERLFAMTGLDTRLPLVAAASSR